MEPRVLGNRLGGFAVLVVIVSALLVNVSGNLVFPVSHKFNGRQGASLSQLKAHDDSRHARFLGAATQNAVDMVLGGNGHPSQNGLYYAKLGIGNPSHDYYVQVDTGSDVFWVMCSECSKEECPTNSEIKGVSITLYDRKSSSSAKAVTCDDQFCDLINENSQKTDCKANDTCNYKLTYGDGETTSGYYVKDDVQFQKATGNFQTTTTSGSVVFGCTTNRSGLKYNPDSAVSGLVGFGQANLSMLSQLVAVGKVRNKFAHCLDTTKQGGGIWAIGEVVEPKIKNTSPLVPNQDHYNVVLETIEVGSDKIELSKSGGVFDYLFGSSSSDESNNTAIFDSGTTLAYLPQELQEQLVKKILAKAPGLKLQSNDEFTCFEFSKNVDETFPIVKFNFKNSASLWVYPHDYLFTLKDNDIWCHGWMKSKPGSKARILLGDMVLSNKVVVYDLEKQVIGWSDHNCSSSIKVKDDQSGSDYSIQYHNLAGSSDASSLRLTMSFVLLATAAAAAAAMLQMISI